MNKDNKYILRQLKLIMKTMQKTVDNLTKLISYLESNEKENSSLQKSKHSTSINKEISITNLKQKTKEEAIEILNSATHKQLSQIFKDLGGKSVDAKKSKKFLIDRIIWKLYDFEEEHDILRKVEK